MRPASFTPGSGLSPSEPPPDFSSPLEPDFSPFSEPPPLFFEPPPLFLDPPPPFFFRPPKRKLKIPRLMENRKPPRPKLRPKIPMLSENLKRRRAMNRTGLRKKERALKNWRTIGMLNLIRMISLPSLMHLLQAFEQLSFSWRNQQLFS